MRAIHRRHCRVPRHPVHQASHGRLMCGAVCRIQLQQPSSSAMRVGRGTIVFMSWSAIEHGPGMCASSWSCNRISPIKRMQFDARSPIATALLNKQLKNSFMMLIQREPTRVESVERKRCPFPCSRPTCVSSILTTYGRMRTRCKVIRTRLYFQ